MRILIVFLSAWMASAAFAQEAQQAPPIQSQQGGSEPADRTAPEPPAASPVPGSAAASAAAGEPRPHGEEATEYWPPIRGYRLKITDTLIAAFMALLFGAIWLLWRATTKLVKHAELNAGRQLRAYLAVIPKTIGGVRPNAAGKIEWVIKNLGQTPAQKIRLRYNFAVLPNPLPARHRFAEPSRDVSNRFALLPKDEAVSHFDGDAFTAQQIEAISRNEARIYCWGHAEYEDVFRARWRCRFLVSVGGEAFSRAVNLPADHPSAPPWSWEYGSGHNEIEQAK